MEQAPEAPRERSPLAGTATLFDDPQARLEPLQRVRMLLAYDGARFSGFAANERVRTVAGVLVEALERVLRAAPGTLRVAGRTDAGVHAWGQVVSFDAPADSDLAAVQRSINSQLAPEVVARAVDVAPAGFDARFDARSRTYRYTILNTAWPNPFLAPYAWHVAAPLALTPMRLATDAFLGEHDFSAFGRKPRVKPGAPEPSMVRRVLRAEWLEHDDGVLVFEIESTSFCQQMARSIAGFLVDVGNGRRRAGDTLSVIRGRDRARAGTLAPAHGLCLWSVTY